MSCGFRRLKMALELIRRPLRRIKPWGERLALLIAVVLAFTQLRAQIGDWQALLAAVSAPLAFLDGAWSGRSVAGRVRRRLRRAPDPDPAPELWLSPMPGGYGILISGRPVGVSIPSAGRDPLAEASLAPADPDSGLATGADMVMPTPPIGRSQHCVLFAVDIAQFTGAGRDDEVQLAVREALYRLLIDSFAGSGIPWRSCVHEDRGDGVVVVIPAHMPTITVVDPLVEQIKIRLRRHNRLSSPVAQVRLRMAVHIGEVYRDRHGLAGKAVNDLFRMLDAADLRRAVTDSGSGVALIVSDYVYQSVIHGGPNGVDPGAYSAVTVKVKQFQARAWLHEADE